MVVAEYRVVFVDLIVQNLEMAKWGWGQPCIMFMQCQAKSAVIELFLNGGTKKDRGGYNYATWTKPRPSDVSIPACLSRCLL